MHAKAANSLVLSYVNAHPLAQFSNYQQDI